jgi:hypothetical protein
MAFEKAPFRGRGSLPNLLIKSKALVGHDHKGILCKAWYLAENSMRIPEWVQTLRTGILAGVIGDLTEFGWATTYADITGEEARAFTRGITSAAGVRAFLPGFHSALLDLAVNMTFVVVLSIILTFAWRAFARKRNLTNPFPFMLTSLTAVWVINFLSCCQSFARR